MSCTAEEARTLLQDALAHYPRLYVLATSPLCAWRVVQSHLTAGAPASPQALGQALQTVIDTLIDSLKPSSTRAASPGPGRRAYLILDQRYRQEGSLEWICECSLHLSRSQYERLHETALGELASRLCAWEQVLDRQPPWQRCLPPSTCTRLFGADPLLEQTLAALRDPAGAAMLILDGFGGLGKTSVAREAAFQALSNGLFSSLSWQTANRRVFTWGEIQPADRPALTAEALLDGIAADLGMPECLPLPYVSKIKHLRRRLGQEPCLLVVDNLETAADVDTLAESLHNLVSATPSRVLITSRTRLESLIPLVVFHLQPLSAADSLALVRHTAVSGAQDLVRAGDERLYPIYSATGGHPLAIQLVVGQASVLPLERVLAGLQSFGPLRTSFYDLIYQAAFDLLAPGACQALVSLTSLDPRGARWDELLAVSRLSEPALEAALDELARLWLLAASGAARSKIYSLHPLTRQYLLATAFGSAV